MLHFHAVYRVLKGPGFLNSKVFQLTVFSIVSCAFGVKVPFLKAILSFFYAEIVVV
jgi:hypothetical protein